MTAARSAVSKGAMSYAVLFALGGILFVVVAMMLTKRRSHPAEPLDDQVGQNRPAAEDITPDRSSISSPAQISQARRHTPPA